MRNYIHIQLCVTLGIAQIIFVAGVEPRLGEGGEVPIGCRSVAVLLHYWFLVSFMWMLMEGVVLYVALVRVFIKYHGRYIAAFTIASYGKNYNVFTNCQTYMSFNVCVALIIVKANKLSLYKYILYSRPPSALCWWPNSTFGLC